MVLEAWWGAHCTALFISILIDLLVQTVIVFARRREGFVAFGLTKVTRPSAAMSGTTFNKSQPSNNHTTLIIPDIPL
jgi:hypothetical protein